MIQVTYIDKSGGMHYRSYKWREMHEVHPLAANYASAKGWCVSSVIKLY